MYYYICVKILKIKSVVKIVMTVQLQVSAIIMHRRIAINRKFSLKYSIANACIPFLLQQLRN